MIASGEHQLALTARAANFAARRHANQRRKGEAAEPYVNHLAEVAHLLAACVSPPDAALIAAGWLHDVVEDTPTPIEEVRALFGDEIAAIVAEVTDDKSLPKAERKRLQETSGPGKSAKAKMVKLADKTSNLRALAASPPAAWSLERRLEYVAFAERVVAGCRGVSLPLEREFDVACAEAKAAAHDAAQIDGSAA